MWSMPQEDEPIETLRRYLDGLWRYGGSVERACEAAGVSRDAIANWRKRLPAFALDEIEMRERIEVEEEIRLMDAIELREERRKRRVCAECETPIPATRATCSDPCRRKLELFRHKIGNRRRYAERKEGKR